MEAFSNPIFQNIDSPIEINPKKPLFRNSLFREELKKDLIIEGQNDLEVQIDKLTNVFLKTHPKDFNSSYEDIKIEVLELKNSLLAFQAKFERQKSINEQNIGLINLFKKELIQKSNEIQRLSLETQTKTMPSFAETKETLEKLVKTTKEPMDPLQKLTEPLIKQIKVLETREKALGTELLKGFNENKALEAKLLDLQKEISLLQDAQNDIKCVEKFRAFEKEKKGHLKDICDLKTSLIKAEEALCDERENLKNKKVLIEKLLEEKRRLFADIKTNFDENSKVISQLELENASFMALLRDFEGKIRVSDEKTAMLEQENQFLKKEINILKGSIKTKTEILEEKEVFIKDIDELNANIKEKAEIIKQLKEELFNVKQEFKTKEKSYLEENLDLKTDISDLKGKLLNIEGLYMSQIKNSGFVSKNITLLTEELQRVKLEKIAYNLSIKALETQQQVQTDTISTLLKEKTLLEGLLDEKTFEIEKKNKENAFILKEKTDILDIKTTDLNKEEEFKGFVLLDENLRLKSFLNEKSLSLELMEKRVKNQAETIENWSFRFEKLETDFFSLQREKSEILLLLKQTEASLKDSLKAEIAYKNEFISLQEEKTIIINEKQALLKELEVKNQINQAKEAENNALKRAVILQESFESSNANSLLLEKTKEIDHLTEEVTRLNSLLTNQVFSNKAMNQTISSYRETVQSLEVQTRGFEVEKLGFESRIRLLIKENEALQADKEKLRDVLSISNKGKENLLLELERKDLMLKDKIDQKLGIIKENDFKEGVDKESTKKKPKYKALSQKKRDFFLKEGIKEKILYNEVVELSQKAIDLLKGYENLISAFHKANKPITTSIKESLKPEINEFYRIFEGILESYIGVSLKEFLLKEKIIRTKGPQEHDINETLANCKTFLLDFTKKGDFLSKKRVFPMRNYLLKHLFGVKEEFLGRETILEGDIIENQRFIKEKNSLKGVFERLRIEISENEGFLPRDSPNYEEIQVILGNIEAELKLEGEKNFEKYRIGLELALKGLEKWNNGGLLMWLLIKRIEYVVLEKEIKEKEIELFEDINSEVD